MKDKTELAFFLEEFFSRLEKKSSKYGVFGNYENLPEYTSNDVDIWVSDYDSADTELKQTAENIGFDIFLKNESVNGANYFIKTTSNGVIHLDLMTETAWSSIVPILSGQQIANNLEKFRSFYVVNSDLETVAHLLFPLVTFGIVKEKYKGKILKNSVESLGVRTMLAQILGVNLSERILNDIKVEDWEAVCVKKRELRYCLIKRQFLKLKYFGLKRLFKFWLTNIKRIIKPTGLVIAFVGNDGCGKSTIIARLHEDISKVAISANSETFYWRPYILPEINKWLPTTKRQHNPIKENELILQKTVFNRKVSLLKLVYYSMDYILGKIVNLSRVGRGGIHIYDRHYDDLIVYPERFGMTLFSKWVMFVRNVIPQPDIVFFLYSRPDVIKARKHEMFDEELERQIDEYLRLGSKYKNFVVIDGEQSIDAVVTDVKKKIVQKMIDKRAYSCGS